MGTQRITFLTVAPTEPMTKRPIRLGFLDTATGEWKVLAHYSSYERADAALERYSERYPHAHVDILDGALAGV